MDICKMSVISTFLIFVIIYTLYRLKKFLKFRNIVNKFPGRKTYFLFGNMIGIPLQLDKLYKYFKDWHKEFPEGYRMWAGHYALFHLVKANDVEVLLSSQTLLEKHWGYEFLQDLLGDGLVTSNGSKWRQRRKLLTPAFHFNILKRFINIFGEHGMLLVRELADECNKSKTDVIPILLKCTLNVMCETSMGITLDMNTTKHREYFEAVESCATIIYQRMLQPLYYSNFFFNLSQSGRKCKKMKQILHEFTSNIIKERESTFNKNILDTIEDDKELGSSKKRFALLDLLIFAKKNNAEIDDAGIQEEVDTFLAAGHDTSAMTISILLLMLANHKNIQERVRVEIDDIFYKSDRHATYDDLQNMSYLEMCIKETLRICPVVPIIFRNITEETKIGGGKYTMPVGSFAFVHIYALHRDPKIFPDPEIFDPDRFLPENVKSRPTYAYVPFSAGPRNCIGQKLAMLEVKSIISSILRFYELEAVESLADKALLLNLVVRMVDGINIKFKTRRQ